MIELSVIIPTYNRLDLLRTCLEALFAQTQDPATFEIIVVIDGSTDGTRQFLAGLTSSCRLQAIFQPNSGQAAALNRGLAAATGRYCLTLDDDIIADPRLLAEHLRVQHAHAGVIGLGALPHRLPPQADDFARFLAAWRAEHHEYLAAGGRAATYLDCFSGNMSAPREALVAAGGFAANLARSFDIELGYRLAQRGLSFVYIPAAIGYQDYRKTFQAIVADAEKAGAASLVLYRRHPPLLGSLALGRFSETTGRALLLRRMLLFLRVPPRCLTPVGRLLGGRRANEWYRFLYAYCFWRGVRQATRARDTWRRLTSSTCILRYHAFALPRESVSRYVVSARRLNRQLAWLKARNYTVLSLEEFLQFHRAYRLPPAHSVILTLDDGYADNATVAYPLFRRYRFPATIFLVSDAIETANTWDQHGILAGRPLLSWSTIRALGAGGIAYGAHTQHHPALPTLPAREAREEITGSRMDLEQALLRPVTTFAYPYGQRSPALEAAVAQAGYLGACGVEEGLNSAATSPYALRRTEVQGTDSLFRFACALWLGTRTIANR